MTTQDDEFRARHAEIARLMNRHKGLLARLRDHPLGTTKGDTDMTTENMTTENNEYRRILAESIARHKVTIGRGGAGGGGATVTVGGSGTMAGAGGGVAGDVPRRKQTAMDELETRIDYGEFFLPLWMQAEVERAMELDSAEGGRAHTDAAFETITGLFERPCGEFIEALTWGVR